LLHLKTKLAQRRGGEVPGSIEKIRTFPKNLLHQKKKKEKELRKRGLSSIKGRGGPRLQLLEGPGLRYWIMFFDVQRRVRKRKNTLRKQTALGRIEILRSRR